MDTLIFFAMQVLLVATSMYIGFRVGVHAAARRARTATMVLMIAAEKSGVDFSAFIDEANRLLDDEIAKR
jgi:hypothetical protein